MTKTRKLLLSLLVLGLSGPLLAAGSYSAFSATTESKDNQFSAGTVALGDNDNGNVMYNVAAAGPGDVVEKCIQVTYTGSLAADVKLYVASALGTLAPYIDLEITPGTQTGGATFPDCTGFTAQAAGPVYTGTLAAFGTAHSTYANGFVDNPGSAASWVKDDAVIYRFRLTVSTDPAAAGKSTGAHTFTWEARDK